jgi:hypothetical protein
MSGFKIIHYGDRGSNLDGDGTVLRPFATREWAELHRGPSDVVCANNVHTNLTPEPPSATLRNLATLLGVWVACVFAFALVAFVIVTLVRHPMAALPFCVLTVLAFTVAPEQVKAWRRSR